jgi:hypothetical protein
VGDQDLVVAGLGDGLSSAVDQGLNQPVESDTRVFVETPGGLSGGEGAGGAWQGAEPGRDNLQGCLVFLDQLEVSVLKSGLDTR